MWVRPRAGGVPADLGFTTDADLPQLPASKSHAQRMVLLAGMLDGEREIVGVGDSLDVRHALRAAAALGAEVLGHEDAVVVRGLPWRERPPRGVVACGENATLLRTLGTLVPALGGALELQADAGLQRRPHQPLFDTWRAMGIVHRSSWPLATASPRALPALPRGVDASLTTQVATGLVLALALRGGGALVVERPGSRDYLQVTARVLRDFGFEVTLRAVGQDLHVAVDGSATSKRKLVVPRDPSARAFVCSLAALHALPVPAVLRSLGALEHPDHGIDADLERLLGAGTVELSGLAARPDSVPALAVAAAARVGVTRMPHLAALRTKESDRLAQLEQGLRACGARCSVVGNGLVVEGPPRSPAGPVHVDCAPDHRIVMALALLGTVLPHGIRLPHADCVAKSWPSFWAWLGRVAHVAREPG